MILENRTLSVDQLIERLDSVFPDSMLDGFLMHHCTILVPRRDYQVFTEQEREFKTEWERLKEYLRAFWERRDVEIEEMLFLEDRYQMNPKTTIIRDNMFQGPINFAPLLLKAGEEENED